MDNVENAAGGKPAGKIVVMDKGLQSTLIYAATGIAAGALSATARVPLYGLGIALIMLAVVSVALMFLLKPENYKWLAGNGAFIFLAAWYAIFTLFFNIGV
ncbi:MAG: hypothetical protein J4431_00730 [Candidatus Aenigmarchaeota archaeon]|nr:hypothetical protein [Candidatus Aenigmarchaeota archaeon]